MRCIHCDARLGESDRFQHNGEDYCCGCMSALCSWVLDGGFVEDPDLFPGVQGINAWSTA